MERGDGCRRLGHRDGGDLPADSGVLREPDQPFVSADQDGLADLIDEQCLEPDLELRVHEAPGIAVVAGAQDAAIRAGRNPDAAAGLIHHGVQIRVVRGVARRGPGLAGVRRSQDGALRSHGDEHAAGSIGRDACEIRAACGHCVRPALAIFGTQDRAVTSPDEQDAAGIHEQTAIDLGVDHLRLVYRGRGARRGRTGRTAEQCGEQEQRQPGQDGASRHRASR